MSTPAPRQTDPSSLQSYDPDSFRMSIGEHLEELRWRLILALIGFAIIAGLCLAFGEQMMAIFCRPLILVLQEKNLNPQLYYHELSDGFMVYIKISLICGAALAAPWMLYQIWQFVAAGLYPKERKYITRYLPLSLILLIAGMLFVYFLILPWTIQFFLTFGDSIPLPALYHPSAAVTQPAALPNAPVLDGDPLHPPPGTFWFNRNESRLKICVAKGDVRVIPFSPSNLLAPQIVLPDYIDLVVGMLLIFGLCFQLPLVVLILVRIGIIDISTLKRARRYVYFAMSVLAAVITPGDVVTAMIALMFPLILLYELGIFLAAWGASPEPPETEMPPSSPL